MAETFVPPEEVLALLHKRRDSLQLLAPFRLHIEAWGTGRPTNMAPDQAHKLIGAMACYIDADMTLFLDGKIKGAREDVIRAALTFVPPAGPASRRPTHCPKGHDLTWLTPRIAVCLDSWDLDCVWVYLPTADPDMVTLQEPIARSLATRIRAAMRGQVTAPPATPPE